MKTLQLIIYSTYFISNRSLSARTSIHMYFYLFSRHCQQVSHRLKFVHEICGVKNQVRDYCGLNTSHFVLYLFCDYVTSVFWALIAK